MSTPRRQAPLKSAPARLALRSDTLVRLARDRLAPDRFTPFMFEPVRFEPRRLASVRSAPEVLALGFLPLESAAPKPTPSSEACISAPPRKSTPISRATARVAPRIEEIG